LLAYAALRIAMVGLVAPIVATQGAVAAVFAVVAGESLSTVELVLLALIAVAVFVVASGSSDGQMVSARARRPGLYAIGAALAIGASLYAVGRVSTDLTVAWSLLPSRLVGAVAVTVPLLVRSELVMTRRALPLVVAGAACEVGGFALFAFGARHGIAIAAVLSSQFAAIAAVGAYLLFGERLAPRQVAGVTVLVASVAVLSGIRA
jgi:drug/metabolite transporter (DMT)-like permease